MHSVTPWTGLIATSMWRQHAHLANKSSRRSLIGTPSHICHILLTDVVTTAPSPVTAVVIITTGSPISSGLQRIIYRVDTRQRDAREASPMCTRAQKGMHAHVLDHKIKHAGLKWQFMTYFQIYSLPETHRSFVCVCANILFKERHISPGPQGCCTAQRVYNNHLHCARGT